MKTAGVVIDDWKLPVFKRHLDAAGFAFQEQQGITKGTLTLFVKYEMVADLQPVIRAANKECATLKGKS